MKADAEHQKDDAELGELLDRTDVAVESRRDGPQHDTPRGGRRWSAVPAPRDQTAHGA